MIPRIEILCHRNQVSISFIYDVFGRSLEVEANWVANTRRDVPAPMNRSLKSPISINKVEYPKSHRIKVGIKVVRSWLVKSRVMRMFKAYLVDLFVFSVTL